MALNFKISEILHSDMANLYHINNMADLNSLDNILNLIYYVLQPLRDYLGCPVRVTGGYRSLALWQKLSALGKNPAKNSQHLTGQAVDIQVPNMDLKTVFSWMRDNLPYDQLLFEYDLKGNKWIHVSYNHGKNRHCVIDNYRA